MVDGVAAAGLGLVVADDGHGLVVGAVVGVVMDAIQKVPPL